MFIFLDSNVLIADPWLQSQKTRMLFDYVEKTFSRIVLVELVEMEVRAHFKRKSTDLIANISNAIKTAERLKLKELPEFNRQQALSNSLLEWEDTFRHTCRKHNIAIAPLDNSILPEAVRRATERIPPCSESGKEVRDTIIWLSMIGACKKLLSREMPFVFISENTKDFAGPDKVTLRRELQEELKQEGFGILYYPSLRDFIEAHAQRLAHVTTEWIGSRINLAELEKLIIQKLQKANESIFEISYIPLRDYYVPSHLERILSLSLEITEPIYIWETKNEEIEISVECDVHVEAEMECVRVIHPK